MVAWGWQPHCYATLEWTWDAYDDAFEHKCVEWSACFMTHGRQPNDNAYLFTHRGQSAATLSELLCTSQEMAECFDLGDDLKQLFIDMTIYQCSARAPSV